MKKYTSFFLLLGLFCNYFIIAQNKPNPPKTLSPFFWVKSKDKNVESLPLKSTAADVNIAGVIADVKITQEYQNTGKVPIEAIYVFPASTKAAVYAMTMIVGTRKLVAKIEEKNKAKEIYELAKEEGKTASLLEQQNPNVFQMNVANILPNDKILVELRYTELLVPTESVYEFTLPTVVGPRYSETLQIEAKDNQKWVENPYLHAGEKPTYTFQVTTRINAGLPIQEVNCSTHKTNIDFLDKSSASVKLAKGETSGGNRDYIVRYRLAGNQVQSGLLLYESENAVASAEDKNYESGESEKFFLLMMQPPKTPQPTQIPPREYVFIVDVSGSMHGFPLEVSKTLLEKLISSLRPIDKFNVMLFESSNQMLSPESMVANKENIQKALDVLTNIRGNGGTRLMPALENAFNFKETQDFSRSFVVITDGYVTVEREAFELIRKKLNNANLFAFGIGSSVNRYLIEGMAHAGQGEPFFVNNQSEADEVGKKFINYIQNPVLTNIKVEYDGFEAYDVEPISIPDVFAERPIIIYGKYKGAKKGKIKLTGLSGYQKYEQIINISEASKENNQALPYLWARNKIMLLDDYQRLYPNEEQKTMVTNLGLKYNLLTEYTSFVAVDTEVRNKNGKNTSVKQPLPMPKGVSDNAIGKREYSQIKGTTSRNISRKKDIKRVSKTNSIAPSSNDGLELKENEVLTPQVAEEKPIVKSDPLEIKEIQPLEINQPTYYKGDEVFIQELIQTLQKEFKDIKGIFEIEMDITEKAEVENIKFLQFNGKEKWKKAIIKILKESKSKWQPKVIKGKPTKANKKIVFEIK
jgi:Ca-activated chloride channel family protein